MTTTRKDDYLKRIRTLESEMVHRELEDIHQHDRQKHNLLVFLLFFLGASIVTAAAVFFSGERIKFREDQPLLVGLKWAKETPVQGLQVLLNIQKYDPTYRKMTFNGVVARVTLKPSHKVYEIEPMPIYRKGAGIDLLIQVKDPSVPPGTRSGTVLLSGKKAVSNTVEFSLKEAAE